MVNGKGNHRMKKEEIQALMDLKGWSKMDLAHELHITENAVHKWFKAGEAPNGPTSILLREWLARAIAEAAATSPKSTSPKSGRKLAAKTA